MVKAHHDDPVTSLATHNTPLANQAQDVLAEVRSSVHENNQLIRKMDKFKEDIMHTLKTEILSLAKAQPHRSLAGTTTLPSLVKEQTRKVSAEINRSDRMKDHLILKILQLEGRNFIMQRDLKSTTQDRDRLRQQRGMPSQRLQSCHCKEQGESRKHRRVEDEVPHNSKNENESHHVHNAIQAPINRSKERLR